MILTTGSKTGRAVRAGTRLLVAGMLMLPMRALPAMSPDSLAVARVIDAYHSALAAGDSVRALTFLAADAAILESGGVESRAEYRSHHLSSDIAFAQAIRSLRSPITVKVNGNTAWASSTSTTQGTYKDRPINSAGAELMVLTKVKGSWKIRAIHWSSRTRRPPA